MKDVQERKYLAERVFWLIKLRWIASIGVACTVFLVHRFTDISIPIFPLYGVALFLFLYNILLFLVILRIKYKLLRVSSLVSILANIQISVDLSCLTVLIHLAGGVENPFIFYFIFHMIIASILLTRREALLQATYAAVLFLLMVFLDYIGVLHHYCLIGVYTHCLSSDITYIIGISFAFISTLYISVYMATSISGQLREREQSLKDANKLLNEKDQIKSKYVLRVTHDIKEDLAAIQSCIEPVTDGITGSLNDGQKNLLLRAKERSKTLIVYVNALLEITKLKLAKELKMEHFDFLKLLNEISEHTFSLAQNKHIKFTSKIGPNITTINGVRVYLKETLLNLLANSLKYTPKGGKIGFEVNEKGDYLLIEIQDTGIGIPENDLPHVFDEFYRAKNAKEQERQGTGLGLSMAKQVVEMHNGRIWVESKEGKGTKLYLELPRQI